MGYEYDVFLSHSRHDSAFAKSVAKMLSEAGLRVWIDVWNLRAGRKLRPALEKAMQGSRHAVFIVTKEWNEGRFTVWECEHFLKLTAQDPSRVLLPILQGIGIDECPNFANLTPLEWPPEVDAETMFWRLWWSLNEDEELGDESEWLEKSRRKRFGPDHGPVSEVRTPKEAQAATGTWEVCGYSREGLSCDRTAQWGQLDTEIGYRRHEAIFVRGSQRRALDWFLRRVEKCLEHKDTEIKLVTWPNFIDQRAMTEGMLKAWLAKAFDCEADDLEASLAAELDGKNKNLVLLHSTVCQDEAKNPFFVSYYTKVLPEVIAGAAQRLGDRAGKVKIIQALAWRDKLLVMRWLAGLLHRTGMVREALWAQHALEKRDVAKAISDIREKAVKKGLHVWPLQELTPIRRRDVKELAEQKWCGEGEEVKRERKKFVDNVMSGNRNSDHLIFQQIMKHLPEEQ